MLRALRQSLTWQIYWPMVAVVGIGAGMWADEARRTQRLEARMESVLALRERLDRSVLRLADRHIRTLRRAREALVPSGDLAGQASAVAPEAASETPRAVDSDEAAAHPTDTGELQEQGQQSTPVPDADPAPAEIDNQRDSPPGDDGRTAALRWASERYQPEMDRLIAEALENIEGATNYLPGPRLTLDIDRLKNQLEVIHTTSQEVAVGLDLVLGAVSVNNLEALTAATAELGLADSSMQTALHIAAGIIRRATTWQARQTLGARGLGAHFYALWGLLVLGAAWLSFRSMRRLPRLVAGEIPGPPLSREERNLGEKLRVLKAETQTMQTALNESGKEAERGTHSARRAEQDLALFKLYNENLVNSLRSAVVVTDGAGRITGFNKPARRLLAMSHEHVGQALEKHELYRAFGARGHGADDLKRALESRQALRREAVTFVHPSGSEILLDLTVAPYVDESGAARGLVWISDDVTEALNAKKQLLAAEHLAGVGRLSAQVAHEIRNPLSAIGLNAELLEEEFVHALSPEARAEPVALLRAIGGEIERLTDVTEGYLQLARMPGPNFKDADLNQMVTDLLTMLREEMRAHHIEVHIELCSPSPRAWVDPGQLRQALLNVVRNAREAMPGGGTLSVTTASSPAPAANNPGYSEVRIADTGDGIPADMVDRIFEPFYSTRPEGTGLGLSLTHQIIAEHGGSISVSPKSDRAAPASGTEIRIRLRQNPDDAALAE